MAINKDVEDSLNEAQGHLRNALFKAAKNERPSTLKQLTDVIQSIDTLIMTDSILDRLEGMKNDRDDTQRFGF